MTEFLSSGGTLREKPATSGSNQLTYMNIPMVWVKTLTKPNGKGYPLAVFLLAKLTFVYRPRPIIDEGGNITEYGHYFKNDTYQISYQALADEFAETKDSIRDALTFLEGKDLIRRELRTVIVDGRKIPNVLFIGIDQEKIDALGGRSEGEEKAPKTSGISFDPVDVSENLVGGVGKFSDTNTNKAKNNQKNNDPSFSSPAEGAAPADLNEGMTPLAEEEVSEQLAHIASSLKEDEQIDQSLLDTSIRLFLREYTAQARRGNAFDTTLLSADVVKDAVNSLSTVDRQHIKHPQKYVYSVFQHAVLTAPFRGGAFSQPARHKSWADRTYEERFGIKMNDYGMTPEELELKLLQK